MWAVPAAHPLPFSALIAVTAQGADGTLAQQPPRAASAPVFHEQHSRLLPGGWRESRWQSGNGELERVPNSGLGLLVFLFNGAQNCLHSVGPI
jgi:hypothetical protein